jgi:uncharacterized protein YjbI with pentapeptide repeats
VVLSELVLMGDVQNAIMNLRCYTKRLTKTIRRKAKLINAKLKKANLRKADLIL